MFGNKLIVLVLFNILLIYFFPLNKYVCLGLVMHSTKIPQKGKKFDNKKLLYRIKFLNNI